MLSAFATADHEVPDFNTMYELYDVHVMFFYRNKHIMIDLGTGNNNKINWAIHDKQEVVDIIETVYRGAQGPRPRRLAEGLLDQVQILSACCVRPTTAARRGVEDPG